MLKIVLILFSLVFSLNASEYDRANAAASKAFSSFDCEFEDCPKEVPKPQIIIKEKVVYKDRPVIVEKIVQKEKVVYRDKPVIVHKVVEKEKVVYRDRPVQKSKPVAVAKEPVHISSNRVYHKAFFDVHTKTQAPMLDYIKYTKRASFDVGQFADTVSKIKEKKTKVYIYGSLSVPNSIKTKQVYMYVGQKYYYSYYSYWTKEIFYNNLKTRQNSDYFLVDTKIDSAGNRYVDYKIYIHLDTPWTIKPAEENVAPNTFFFKMAPKTRGFKNKFIVAKPFIIEE